jgi:predicted permease
VLVVAQVAMSVVVLVTTGLFVRSIQSLRSIEAGFDAGALLHVVPVALDRLAAGGAADPGWREQLVARLQASAEVESLAWADAAPLSGSIGRRTLSAEPGAADNLMNLGTSAVSTGYFRTTGIPLRAGRDFSEADLDGPPRVIIVNEVLARELWPGEAAVGQTLYAGTMPLQVVGVAATAKYFALSEPPQRFFYTPLDPASDPRAALLLRTSGSPATLAARVRNEIQALPGAIAARRLATLDDIVAATYGPQRAFAEVTGLFALLAFVLAVAGTYGLTSYLVSRRTVEIGIRVALGARSASVLRGVLRQTLLLGLIGVVLGLLAARAAVPALSSLVPGIEPTDLTTFAVVAASLLASVALAGFFPARRAARIDPLIALRRE